ncbi:hypothetical protein Nepgr_011116 [Nepenthes gracilis]|uniref:Uncharacterized protein n=1 Tax=Nepenthes gracilis TaxID=150966 RepID=A0AAD3SDG9_NEPGR|nr:hypothetical protein Nepgr_011116 [Nepenthes gracilis]
MTDLSFVASISFERCTCKLGAVYEPTQHSTSIPGSEVCSNEKSLAHLGFLHKLCQSESMSCSYFDLNICTTLLFFTQHLRWPSILVQSQPFDLG